MAMTQHDDSWKWEMETLVFQPTSTHEKIEEGMKIKFKNLPERLYKYSRFSKFSELAFRRDFFYMSKPTDFNDPYDTAVVVDVHKIAEQLAQSRTLGMIQYLLENSGYSISPDVICTILTAENPHYELARQLYLQNPEPGFTSADDFARIISKAFTQVTTDFVRNTINDVRNGFMITCFSEDNRSTVMWSHYADNHTGFCLEFDFKNLGISHHNTRLLFPINYFDERIDMTDYYLDYLMPKKPLVNGLYLAHGATRKSTEWAYEKEWRLFHQLVGAGIQNENQAKVWSGPTPTAVYLGARVSDKDKLVMVMNAREKGIPVYQMKIDDTTYVLNCEEISMG